jgi:3-oxoacyl-[acyl-carrier protein] reductase
MDLGLTDHVFLVTGGTQGLGRATAETLLAEGAKVVVSSRRGPGGAGADSLPGWASLTLAADNGDPATADWLVEATIEAFGRLDGLLVSGGGPPHGSALEAADDEWRLAFESVFLGAVRLARVAAPRMRRPGVIAFVLSRSVREPTPGLAVSSGLIPGLAMTAKSLADELGPDGIRVVGLVPGRIATANNLRFVNADPEVRARNETGIPLRRLGKPEEFGRVAAFVMSPAASYVTGCCIFIDGGLVRAL